MSDEKGWKKGTVFDEEAMARLGREYNRSQLKEYIDTGQESISGFIKWLKGLASGKRTEKNTNPEIYEAKKGGLIKKGHTDRRKGMFYN